jgi:hypothetical protein
VNEPRQNIAKVLRLQISRIRYLLLLLAMFVYGGTAVDARVVEVVGAECASSESQEAANTRRQSTHSKRIREHHAADAKELVAKPHNSTRPCRRRSGYDETSVSKPVLTSPSLRAPPVIA